MSTNEIIEAYVDDVARRLPRRQRNDVGMELRSLLNDELCARAQEAGTEPDRQMTLELLRNFGSPDDVAERYRPAGFVVIEPSAAPGFVKASIIGVAIQWLLTLPGVFLAEPPPGLDLGIQLSRWWATFGLGALWWPGFLVTCYGISAAVRRRRRSSAAWVPSIKAVHSDLVSRVAIAILVPLGIVGTTYLVMGPAWIVDRLLPDGIDTSWANYAAGFQRVWLPLFVGLIAIDLALLIVAAVEGSWRALTRRIAIATNIAWLIVLIACVGGGRVFALESSDGIAKLALLIVAAFVAIDLIVRLRRELMRVRQYGSFLT